MLREIGSLHVRRDRKFYTSLALHRAVLEHLESEPERVIRRGRDGVRKTRPHTRGEATAMLDTWEKLFRESDLHTIRELLTGVDEYAVEMRNLTPFLDVLSQEERNEIVDEELRQRRWER